MGAMASALQVLSGSAHPIYTAPWLIAAPLMTFNSSTMLHQQGPLNRWDLNKAQGIDHDLQIRVGPGQATHIALSGANYACPRLLTTTDGDLNASALAHFRSLEGLLSETSGDQFIVDDVSAAPAAATASPIGRRPEPLSRPQKESMFACDQALSVFTRSLEPRQGRFSPRPESSIVCAMFRLNALLSDYPLAAKAWQ